MWLVVGLGNPGSAYATHRHNIGFMVVEELRRRWHAPKATASFGAEMAKVLLDNQQVLLQKPMEFMNVSGRAVQRCMQFYRVETKQVIVIHDDLDLPFETVRVKQDGGSGGHNGLRSISEHIGTGYLRVRCGIGRPSNENHEQISRYVLSPFDKLQQDGVGLLIQHAADATKMIVQAGVEVAMNQWNQRSGKQ